MILSRLSVRMKMVTMGIAVALSLFALAGVSAWSNVKVVRATAMTEALRQETQVANQAVLLHATWFLRLCR